MPDSVSYMIAGHCLRIVGDRESALLRRIPGFPVFAVENVEPEWQVVFGKEIVKPEPWNEIYHFVFEADTMSCSLAKNDGVYYFAMEPYDHNVPPLLMRYDGNGTVEATVGADPDMLRFALWLAMGMLSLPSNRKRAVDRRMA